MVKGHKKVISYFLRNGAALVTPFPVSAVLPLQGFNLPFLRFDFLLQSQDFRFKLRLFVLIVSGLIYPIWFSN